MVLFIGSRVVRKPRLPGVTLPLNDITPSLLTQLGSSTWTSTNTLFDLKVHPHLLLRHQKTRETMFFTQILHTGQVALCAYGAYVSYIAIRNLQQYEETSKKAAKYSGEAEHQLHKTRTTQASGAVCVSPDL